MAVISLPVTPVIARNCTDLHTSLYQTVEAKKKRKSLRWLAWTAIGREAVDWQ